MISLKRLSVFSFAILLTAIGAATYVPAQQPPLQIKPLRPSQKASVMQTVGVTDITITYSRPPVKGRTIFADAPATMAARAKGEATLDNQNERKAGEPIVPYDHVWRAGANEATMFVVTDDVLINGQPLKAGTYSMHTVPGKDEWTIIFNNDAGQWGSFAYDEKKDALRVKTKPQMVAENQEWLMYSFDPVTENSAQVNIRWEKMRVPFTVEVKDVKAVWRARADAIIAANPTNEVLPLQVANTYAGDKKWDEALKFVDQSIKVKETFRNLSAKATILYGAGRKEESFAVADQAIAKGKADKVDTAAFEKRFADMRTAARITTQGESTTPSTRILTRDEGTTAATVTAAGRYYALIIGNDRYQYVPGLEMAEADASAVASVLRDKYGFSANLLLNAKRQDIISALNNYRRTLDADDSLLIYYAGHGYYDREVERAYWLPVDARRDDNANWISADDITGGVRGVAAKHVLIISDSCYSGTISRDLAVSVSDPVGRSKFLQKMMAGKSRTLMSSGGNEPVSDGGGSGHSVFARAFLTGLEQQNKNAFTASELFRDFIQERVAGGARQTPEYSPLRYSGHDSGDFVFVRR